MKRILLSLSILFILLVPALPQWTKIDAPSGVPVSKIYADGTSLWGLSEKNLYKYSNDSWNLVFTCNASLNEVIRKGNYLYLATAGMGIYRSADNGKTWNDVNQNTVAWQITHLAICEDTLIAFSDGSSYYRTWSNGAQWEQKSGPQSYQCSHIMMDTILLLGTNNGVYKSYNGARTWLAANTGITGNTVKAFAAKNEYLFAATSNAGIYLSVDTAKTWTSVNTNLSQLSINDLYILNDTIWAATTDSIFYATNFNNISWKSATSQKQFMGTKSFAVSGNKLLIANTWGVFRKDKQNFAGFNNGLSITPSYMFVHNDTLFASTSNATYSFNTSTQKLDLNLDFPGYTVNQYLRMNDTTILVANNNGLYIGKSIKTLKLVTSKSIKAIAFTKNTILISSDYVYRSQNFGKTWTQANIGIPTSYYVYDLAFKNTTAYALIADVTSSRIFTSTDYGDQWTEISNSSLKIKKLFAVGDSLIGASKAWRTADIYSINGTNFTSLNLRDQSIFSSNLETYIGDYIKFKGNSILSINSDLNNYAEGIAMYNPSTKFWVGMNKGLADTSVYDGMFDKNYQLKALESKNMLFGRFRMGGLMFRDMSNYSIPQTPENFVMYQTDTTSNGHCSFKWKTSNASRYYLTTKGFDYYSADTVTYDKIWKGTADSSKVKVVYAYFNQNHPEAYKLVASYSGDDALPAVASLALETSIKEKLSSINKNISIYPNPAINEITVSLSDGTAIEKIYLFNAKGTQLMATETATNNVRIDLTGLSQGIYYLNAVAKTGTYTGIVLKK